MELIRRLPPDVANRIIPYTYDIQPAPLLADIRHYTSSLSAITDYYKKSIWWTHALPPPTLPPTLPPRHITGLLFDLSLLPMGSQVSNTLPINSQKRIVNTIWGKLTIRERENFIREAKAPTP